GGGGGGGREGGGCGPRGGGGRVRPGGRCGGRLPFRAVRRVRPSCRRRGLATSRRGKRGAGAQRLTTRGPGRHTARRRRRCSGQSRDRGGPGGAAPAAGGRVPGAGRWGTRIEAEREKLMAVRAGVDGGAV